MGSTCPDDEECVQEFSAFARGGACGIERLQHTYENILKEYSMRTESLDSLLWRAGLQMRMGKISSRY